MEKLTEYKVELRNMREESCSYDYELDNQFFAMIDAPEIQKGNLKAHLSVRKSMGAYMLDFHIEGVVTVTCDRCLDDLEMRVATDNSLKVKLGAEFSDEEDIVIVPEEEGYVDVAWFLYEFIELSLPMKRMHAPGQCNEAVMRVLDKHLAYTPGDEEDTLPEGDLEDSQEPFEDDDNAPTDSRWDDLKKILNNNNK